MPKGRRRALTGRWVGAGYQAEGVDGGPPLDAKLILDITAHSKTVKATGEYTSKVGATEEHTKFAMEGGFFHDRFLKFDYKNTDDTAIQFGAITAELSPDGRTIRGRYIGYGPFSERLVNGSIELHKQV